MATLQEAQISNGLISDGSVVLPVHAIGRIEDLRNGGREFRIYIERQRHTLRYSNAQDAAFNRDKLLKKM